MKHLKAMVVGFTVVFGAMGLLIGYLAVVAHIALEAGVGPEGNDHWGIAATSLIVLVIVGVVSYGAGMGIIGSYRWRQLERKVRDKRLELSR